jgi:hypothetical protein
MPCGTRISCTDVDFSLKVDSSLNYRGWGGWFDVSDSTAQSVDKGIRVTSRLSGLPTATSSPSVLSQTIFTLWGSLSSLQDPLSSGSSRLKTDWAGLPAQQWL